MEAGLPRCWILWLPTSRSANWDHQTQEWPVSHGLNAPGWVAGPFISSLLDFGMSFLKHLGWNNVKPLLGRSWKPAFFLLFSILCSGIRLYFLLSVSAARGHTRECNQALYKCVSFIHTTTIFYLNKLWGKKIIYSKQTSSGNMEMGQFKENQPTNNSPARKGQHRSGSTKQTEQLLTQIGDKAKEPAASLHPLGSSRHRPIRNNGEQKKCKFFAFRFQHHLSKGNTLSLNWSGTFA